jgi:hypothetical protein
MTRTRSTATTDAPSGSDAPLGASVPNAASLIYRWDLDKTYLRTEFDTVRNLLKTALERPDDKRTVPGAAALLRELRASGPRGIHILSGSPEQMRRALEEKLRLDGIRWDELTLKPNLRNLLRGRFRALRDQVGYKLGALLASREAMTVTLDEILFGDDAETDALVYSLYADVCAGGVGSAELADVLERTALTEQQRTDVMRIAARLPRRDCCRRIFIHLQRVSPLDAFAAYGPRVCPFYNYLQPALVLVDLEVLDARAALRVAADLVIDQAFDADGLVASHRDLAMRGQVGPATAERVCQALGELDDIGLATARRVVESYVATLARAAPTWESVLQPPRARIDYVPLLASERDRLRRARARSHN